MISRYKKRKLLSKINFGIALSSSSSPAPTPPASPSGHKCKQHNAPLEPPADDHHLHPPKDNAVHSCLPKEGDLWPRLSTPPLEELDVEFLHNTSPMDSPNRDRHHRKKDNQYQHWQNEVIPALIGPYLDILRQTDNMRLPLPKAPLSECQCVHGGRPLKVLGVSWTSE